MAWPAHRFLQANLNHCARSQDLLLQSMAEWLIDAAVAAEPYFVPPRENYLGDTEGSVAIIGRPGSDAPLTLRERGQGYVAGVIGETVVFGVYFSPNKSLADFEVYLDGLGAAVRRSLPRQVLVVGDLNAKSVAWGCPRSDARGEVLEEWAVVTGLEVLNRGSVNTCVRQQGGSIVDVTFATPAVARQVRDWKVLEEVETLSDHLYVRFDVSIPASTPDLHRPTRCTPSASPRWALKRLDRDVLVEASIVMAWQQHPAEPVEVEEEATWFRGAMSQVCDAAMPRVRPRPSSRQVYWWSTEIAALRRTCVAARREYTRSRRRRRRDETVEAQLYESYREAKKTLQLAIGEAKTSSKEEFLETLNSDPWGRPYLAVRGKLRTAAPPLTQSLQPQFVEEVVSTLFPIGSGRAAPRMAPPHLEGDADTGVPEVTSAELRAAMLKLRGKNTAPGPDGVPGRALVLAFDALGDRLGGLFRACLESGRFPRLWKTGRLVLLKKEGRPAESPSAYRPIVLLDEVAKVFERVIARRLVKHMTSVGPDLSESQYGFRESRSTVDAILRVAALSEEAMSRGGVAMAVSLDIANAFNTLPWGCIEEALRYHGAPPYLRRIIGSYLSERYITYQGRNGEVRREMRCGVPQGSVLGPLLWNIGYDWVLRGTLLPGLSVVCYADDTLVVAREKNFRESARLATVGVAQVVGRIRQLGLEVALEKSEALCFHRPRHGPPVGSHITVGGVRIEVGSSMKYLGLVLDSRWDFREHFRRLAPKLMKAAAALGWLLPNLGGPNAGCRRLYMGVVRSMALYGAPVWAGALTARNVAQLRKPQRAMAVRVVRGYRTISFEAACALAGSPPWDLEAGVLASLYEWRSDCRLRGEHPPPRAVRERRSSLRRSMLQEWEQRLARPTAGLRTVEAVRPVLRRWTDRRRGTLSFRATQVLSGHGCFGRYLHRVARREPTAECHHCDGCQEDTAQHTLAECPGWAVPRRDLVASIGGDLSLPAVVAEMVSSDESWAAVLSFCETVVSLKERAEREREWDPIAPSSRRPRLGRRRRAEQRLLPP